MGGFTKLENDILEEMSRRKFNGTQYRILFAVWRFTYGFQRKQHDMSLNFIADFTGIERSRVKKDLNKLIEAKVISVVQEASFNRTRVISFNEKFSQWMIEQSVSLRPQGANLTIGGEKNSTTGGKTDYTTGGRIRPPRKKD